MKRCFKCNIEQPLEDFYKHREMADGHVNKCKRCNKKDVRDNYASRRGYYQGYDRTRQRKDKRRIFNHRYNQIKQRVEGRAIREYSVGGKELLSYEDYCKWVIANMSDFDALYEDWETSGFSRRLTPSIDRIDNNGSYTLDNMRWISLANNCKKGPF